MHKTRQEILNNLPATQKELQEKLGIGQTGIAKWIKRLTMMQEIKVLYKKKRDFREGPGESVYGKLE